MAALNNTLGWCTEVGSCVGMNLCGGAGSSECNIDEGSVEFAGAIGCCEADMTTTIAEKSFRVSCFVFFRG